jgi:NAD(P)-dependent dehydrogenase (short-subunit alcohol dehydrogenase family)
MRATMLDVDPDVESVARTLGASSIVVDLTDADATRRALADSLAEGPYWLLVNNAGVFSKTGLLEMSLDEWDHVQRVNVRSMVITIQALAPAMIDAGGGRVVNMASMAAKRGTPGEAAYAASKAAVVALTRIAAMELGPHGVTVNSVCPGYVLTDMGLDTRSPDQVAAWTSMSPLGRLGDPADVAGVVAFLAGEDGSYLTGQALNVTGGMCTW